MTYCWTVIFKGGSEFNLALNGGPGHSHDGGLSLWKFVGSREHLDILCAELAREDPSLNITVLDDVDDSEVEDERERRLKGGNSYADV